MGSKKVGKPASRPAATAKPHGFWILYFWKAQIALNGPAQYKVRNNELDRIDFVADQVVSTGLATSLCHFSTTVVPSFSGRYSGIEKVVKCFLIK